MANSTPPAAPASPARRSAASARAGSGKVAKTQLIEQVAGRTGLSRKQAGEAVACMLEGIQSALREGRNVGLPGLGTLSVQGTAARTGVRPGTSEKIQIPAGRKIRFKAATTLKGNL
jgi:DNA-binding protein HU-beta